MHTLLRNRSRRNFLSKRSFETMNFNRTPHKTSETATTLSSFNLLEIRTSATALDSTIIKKKHLAQLHTRHSQVSWWLSLSHTLSRHHVTFHASSPLRSRHLGCCAPLSFLLHQVSVFLSLSVSSPPIPPANYTRALLETLLLSSFIARTQLSLSIYCILHTLAHTTARVLAGGAALFLFLSRSGARTREA